jgi:putative endonuclease
MAGLVPAIPIRETASVRQFYVYILASRPGRARGVTNDLVRRVYEHKKKMVAGHTRPYCVNRLVYFEIYDGISSHSAGEEHQALDAGLENAAYRERNDT